MSITFRDPKSFAHEATQVAAWAGVAGFIAPFVTGAPLALSICGAALFGGTLGAATSREGPLPSKGLIGAIGGGLATLGFAALATRFGLGDMGALIGGALGGLGIGALLSSDEQEASSKNTSAAIGGLAGAILGLTSVAAVANVAKFVEASGAPVLVMSGLTSALMGLWIAAGAGVRRLEKSRDPILVRAQKLMAQLDDVMKDKVAQAMMAYAEIKDALSDESLLGPILRDDAMRQVHALALAVLNTAESHGAARKSANDEGLATIEEKLASMQARLDATDDPVSLGHLTRAVQALRAQRTALQGLTRTLERSEAAIEAQGELLRRLRLAVNRARTEDKEHVSVELSAIDDQVQALSDDLDALNTAISEAESFNDRQLLADVERAGRRALEKLAQDEQQEERAVHLR